MKQIREDSGSGLARHAPVDALEAYQREGIAGAVAVDGTPEARIQISPHTRQLSVLVLSTTNVSGPDLGALSNLRYELHADAGRMWHRLDVSYGENLAEVYPVICTIVDRVQFQGQPFPVAVEAVLAGLA